MGELGFFEKATTMLEDLLKLNEKSSGQCYHERRHDAWTQAPSPDAPAIKAELQRFKVMEKAVTKKADTKMRG